MDSDKLDLDSLTTTKYTHEQIRDQLKAETVESAELLVSVGLREAELKEENHRLREALEEFGSHKSVCGWMNGGDYCTCGLEAALAPTERGDGEVGND